MTFTKFLMVGLLFLFSSSVLAVDYHLPNNQWRIITLPAEPPRNKNTVEKIFGDDISAVDAGAEYGKKWALYLYDSAAHKYESVEYGSPLKQGQGYWIIQHTGQTVTLAMPEGSIDTPNTYSFGLVSFSGGTHWVLSGNPFSVPKRLGGFSVKTDSGVCSTITCDLNKADEEKILHNNVWSFDGNQYVKKNVNNILNPWEGFWIPVLENSAGYNLSLAYTIMDKPNYRDAGAVPELSKEWWGSMGANPVKMVSIANPEYPNPITSGEGYPLEMKDGKLLYYKSIFGKIKMTIDLFYPAGLIESRPTVFYISGWHHYHSEQVYSLLYFIASQGYNAVFLSYDNTYRGHEPDRRITSDKEFLKRMVRAVSDHFSGVIDINRIGIIGHSMGGGSVFNLAQQLHAEGWGAEGLFLFTAAGGDAYFQDEGSINLPVNTKMIVQTYNEEKNNRPYPEPNKNWDTDPRFSVDYLKNNSIDEIDKTYLYLPGDANHISNHSTIQSPYNYDNGQYSYDALQQVGVFRPLKSLMEYSFNNNTDWKKIGLPDDDITSMRKGPNNSIEYYSGDDPCNDLNFDDTEKDPNNYRFSYSGVRQTCN
ncbi:MAG: hypothetical protein L3J59_10045 [Methylococcaceae bacterium]|nr:hypothetical protein [Methylococcaceae bacterium]